MTKDQLNELRAILSLPPIAEWPAWIDPIKEAWIEAIELSDVPPAEIPGANLFWARACKLRAEGL